MPPFRSVIAPLEAPAFGATTVAGGQTGVGDYQQGKSARPVHGTAGRNGGNRDSGLEHCAKPILYAQGSAASGWVKNAVVKLH
jgi:hypothetical protein